MELFFTPPRALYDEEFRRRVSIAFRDAQIPFISPEDLVLRKLVNTRLRRGLDFQDAVSVLAVQGVTFDEAYVRNRCQNYRVCELFDDALKVARGS
ncbi:MAG: hypothetical protein ACYDDF_14310 [Thermoplasmatota archaeon]